MSPLPFLDINECTEGSHNCSSNNRRICNNTNGSFDCICDTGYHEENHADECIGKPLRCSIEIQLIYGTLSDDDECLMRTNLCEQTCTNMPGSYECSCHNGYNESGFHCIGKSSYEMYM